MKIKIFPIIISVCLLISPIIASAEEKVEHKDDPAERLELYHLMETVSGIPWYFIGGIDQYERSIRLTKKDLPPLSTNISIEFSDEFWCGLTNPNPADTSPKTIAYFDGKGVDGNNDGIISRNSDEDLLMTMIEQLKPYGFDESHFKIGLWNFYKRDRAVSLIMGNAHMFEKFGTNELQQKAFPLSKGSNYNYKDTYGMARGWGGRRSHEGIDLFANYGTEVHSANYGVVELMGWNKFGGWRLGIRDINNSYYYYAHLGSFAKDLKVGDIVEPGQTIGAVGSSGYGPKGTSGKFPPHLHFGMYKDNGKREWAFNPYPFLVKWERENT